jgi:hypothetical protein
VSTVLVGLGAATLLLLLGVTAGAVVLGVTACVPVFLVVSTALAVFLPFKLPKPCAVALIVFS